MPVSRNDIKFILNFIVIILLASQAGADFNKDKDGKISSHFYRTGSQYESSGPEYAGIKAIVHLDDANKTQLLEDYAAVEAVEGDLVQIRTDRGHLKQISELPFVNYVREPRYPHNDAVNEGVLRMQAQKLHNFGNIGNGVKIAVLDAGFQNYQSLAGTSLPVDVITMSFRADGDIFAGKNHGTAVAELVHSAAPGADLYLVNYETELEFKHAVNWLIQQRVDIITHSAGYTTGPFDGTGFIDDIVNTATGSGIVWVNSAGNYARRHWEGNFTDLNGNSFNEFSGSGDETQDINVQAGQLIEASLSWDDWIMVDQDFELFLEDESGNIVAGSEDPQNGRSGQEPAESFEYIANSTGTYKIMIKKYSATRDVFFQLYSSTHNFEYQIPSRSLVIPSDARGVIAAGASYWQNDALEYFSSRGPTMDGRIKPDITAPDGVSTETYGRGAFFGTSASAPNAAGSIALLMSIRKLSVNEVKSSIESSAVDLGDAGRDNLYGAGRIDIYKAYEQLVPPHIEITHPVRWIFNLNDNIQIGGISSRASEPVNISIKNTGMSLDMETFTAENGTWEISLDTANFSAGNITINASMPPAYARSALMLVNRMLVLNITPSVVYKGNPVSVGINVRDMTFSPVSGAEVNITGENLSITNITNMDGDAIFFLTANGQLNISAKARDYPAVLVGLTVRPLEHFVLSVPLALMKLNETLDFTAVTAEGYPVWVDWASSNRSVGIIDPDGRFTAKSTGISIINATFQNLSASAAVVAGKMSEGTLFRVLPASVLPDENFTVTLVPSGPFLFSRYRAVENMLYLSRDRSTLISEQVNGSNISYVLSSPPSNGIYVFSGRFEDSDHNIGDISGASVLVVGNLVSIYDRDGNGRINRDEAVQSVIDYFRGILTKEQVMLVLIAHFME